MAWTKEGAEVHCFHESAMHNPCVPRHRHGEPAILPSPRITSFGGTFKAIDRTTVHFAQRISKDSNPCQLARQTLVAKPAGPQLKR